MTADTEAPDSRGAILLGIAREALAEAVGREAEPAGWDHPWLSEEGACFVTLRGGGALRGCIGTLRPHRPLIEDLRGNTRAAALEDPRFPALTAAELERVSLEVSLLSPLEELKVSDEASLVAALRPGVDGACLEYRHFRGAFLPQVWESLPEPREFVRQLKRKAGLAEDFWSPELRAWRFTVEKFSE